MDLNDVETIDFNALGGADTIVVNDLSRHRRQDGQYRPRRRARRRRRRRAADTVMINGTNGNDTISLSLDASGRLVVDGLATQVVVENFELDDTIRDQRPGRRRRDRRFGAWRHRRRS